MKRIAYLTITLLCISFITSCENFRDDNGDLGGMWQLTMWQTKSSSGMIDSVVATSETGIYYSINRRIIQYTCTSQQIMEYGNYIFGQFLHTPDSLFLFNFTYSAPYDSIPSESVLRKIGINEDGAYRINNLSSSQMMLSDNDNILTFRKY